ncbi:carbonic anhydrase [Roseibium sp.]|uniref:carbonic anhydrase n=1 Tax=Roseibium sp. TaxID=1936156 RepID=UPI003BB0B268
MTSTSVLFERNAQFAEGFDKADLPILPTLNMMIVTCIDARVDPAHVLGLDLGEAVIIRNNGGRATRAVIEEITVLSAMLGKLNGSAPAFDVVLMQHTQCGAENFANPELQAMLMEKFGIDVSDSAITDHELDLKGDVERLRDAKGIPGSVTVSAVLYDVKTGRLSEIAAPAKLADLRQEAKAA